MPFRKKEAEHQQQQQQQQQQKMEPKKKKKIEKKQPQTNKNYLRTAEQDSKKRKNHRGGEKKTRNKKAKKKKAEARHAHPERGEVLHDARRVLLLLLGRVSVVEAHDHLAAVVLRIVLVQQAGLHVSNVKVSRGLRGKPGYHLDGTHVHKIESCGFFFWHSS